MTVWMPVLVVLAALAPLLAIGAGEAAAITNDAFRATWARTDQPVADGRAGRAWLWGSEPLAAPQFEPYAEAPGGRRLVQYFEKARMELADPPGDPGAPGRVTSGLLARELLTGRLQLGDGVFTQHGPARAPVAGDPGPDAPTYAAFNPLMDAAPAPIGSTIVQNLDTEGQVSTYRMMAEYGVTAARHAGAPRHAVASVFWEFMNASGPVVDGGRRAQDRLVRDPFDATGYPLTEAYWMTARVGGVPRRVLAQVFERRVLTYTPDNPAGWTVEAGNVGRHYVAWRYGDLGYGTCSTLDEPAEVAEAWLRPGDAMAQVERELGRTTGWSAFAMELRGVHDLANAPAGCFNASTVSFYPWLKATLQEDRPRFPHDVLREQIRIAVEQPGSPIGRKIRQIERGEDRLRPVAGPRAYGEYLLYPRSRLTMGGGGLLAGAMGASFEERVREFESGEWRRHADFGAYLVASGFAKAWLDGE